MGNCLERCRQHVENKEQEHEQEEKTGEVVKENGGLEKSSMRIKIVLTKEELEWLLFQLKNKEGKSLEDVLGEIERSRSGKAVGWKPSLESIMEIPEVFEMDR